MIRTDSSQPNLLDGSIFAYDIRADGCYVTVKGNSERPLILSFDSEDITVLRTIVGHYPPDSTDRVGSDSRPVIDLMSIRRQPAVSATCPCGAFFELFREPTESDRAALDDWNAQHDGCEMPA